MQICSSYEKALEENTINLDHAPLGSYNELDGGVDGGGEEDDLEEIDAGVYTTSSSIRKRSKSYTVLEDEILIKAWESVTLDASTGTDQTGKRYWQRIEDKFFKLMAEIPGVEKTPRSFRSLQGRWDTLKPACNRWCGCLEQVYNAPPSGTNEGDWVSFIVHFNWWPICCI